MIRCFGCGKQFDSYIELARHIIENDDNRHNKKGAKHWALNKINEQPKPLAKTNLTMIKASGTIRDVAMAVKGSSDECLILGVDISKEFPITAREINRIRKEQNKCTQNL